ncbi:hypothetical protein LZ32DRAFT_41512 [Colletotrichum eremochloae]|nr:hypothetical protein LZ32DRAFT_41512 [Colletotrichum eremochloae]
MRSFGVPASPIIDTREVKTKRRLEIQGSSRMTLTNGVVRHVPFFLVWAAHASCRLTYSSSSRAPVRTGCTSSREIGVHQPTPATLRSTPCPSVHLLVWYRWSGLVWSAYQYYYSPCSVAPRQIFQPPNYVVIFSLTQAEGRTKHQTNPKKRRDTPTHLWTSDSCKPASWNLTLAFHLIQTLS